MKKPHLSLLPAVAIIAVAFTLGFLLGRNQNRQILYLSAMPTTSLHMGQPEPTVSTDVRVPEPEFPIDLNTAGIWELMALPGIGENLARRIIDYREHYGPFGKPEDLMNVEGIGPGKLESILDCVITGG